MNFLFEKDEVALDAMAAAFSHATQPSDICLKSQDELPLMRSEDRIEIIKSCVIQDVLPAQCWSIHHDKIETYGISA
ncbi:hypothetical protein PC116_g26025 [Phytophthora cactorum]|nr:hypothetical protein PC116_g26025 [Phytophthora cactorum]